MLLSIELAPPPPQHAQKAHMRLHSYLSLEHSVIDGEQRGEGHAHFLQGMVHKTHLPLQPTAVLLQKLNYVF